MVTAIIKINKYQFLVGPQGPYLYIGANVGLGLMLNWIKYVRFILPTGSPSFYSCGNYPSPVSLPIGRFMPPIRPVIEARSFIYL
jgi:hypothetical protein